MTIEEAKKIILSAVPKLTDIEQEAINVLIEGTKKFRRELR